MIRESWSQMMEQAARRKGVGGSEGPTEGWGCCDATDVLVVGRGAVVGGCGSQKAVNTA